MVRHPMPKSLKTLLALAAVLAVALSFYLGRVTADRDSHSHKEEEGHGSSSAHSEARDQGHSHSEGEADPHEGQGAEGLRLSAEEQQNIGLKVSAADFRPLEQVIRVAGMIKAHPDREAQVSSRVLGRIARLMAKVGDPVKKGQPLAELQSTEIQKLQVELIQAENRLALAEAELERIKKLVEEKIAARKEMIAAETQRRAILNEIEGLSQQLVLLGLSAGTAKKVREAKTTSTFTLFSPIQGVVAERNGVLGEGVEPGKLLFKILDPSMLLAEGSAFEETLPQLKIGQRVRIRPSNHPGEPFSGRISRLSPAIDPQKRTLLIWAEVPNPGGKLKANLSVEMAVVVGGGQEVLSIPLESLISAEGMNFVFVEEKGSFRRADLLLGARDDRYVEVKSGLLPGDQVVTDGKQQVYTKSLLARQGGVALGGHSH